MKTVSITNYKIKFFNFLAGGFRRAAEILSVEPVITKSDNSDKNDSAPPADWLKRIQHISPEEWFDFSEENNELAITVPTETNPAVDKLKETEIKKVKPTKNQNIELTAESDSESASTPKKDRPKRFLSFNTSEKNQPKRDSESAEKSVQVVHHSQTETGIFSPALNKKIKFLTFSTVPIRKSKSADSAPPFVETLIEKSTATIQTSTVSEKVKSGHKTGKTISRESNGLNKKKNQIITESLPPKEFSLEELSRIDSIELRETAKNNPVGKKMFPPNDFNFTAKKNKPSEDHLYFTIEKPNEKTAFGNPKVKCKQEKEEIENSNIFAAPPWIDLPESFFSGEFNESETVRTETDHLLYLKREQDG